MALVRHGIGRDVLRGVWGARASLLAGSCVGISL
jgi:hypothetical protein